MMLAGTLADRRTSSLVTMRSPSGTSPGRLFTRLPVHGFVFLFHLELHRHVWVHADDLEPYAYDPGLKERLVLPREQTDLIDLLTAIVFAR